MPDQGTLLYNLQTQKDEWVGADQVKTKLASGSYKATQASEQVVDVGGAEAQLGPDEAQARIAAGAINVGTEQRDLASREAAQVAQYDNAGDKALQFVSGMVEGVSGGGLVLPRPEWEQAASDKANGGWSTAGDVASLALVALFPESVAGKFTPLGGANRIMARAQALAKESSFIGKVAIEAGGGALAGGALAESANILRTVTGRPTHPDAVLDDIELGGLVGGGFGAAGAVFEKLAGRVKDAKSEIAAASRFDESVVPVHGALNDATKAWDQAHRASQTNYKLVKDAVDGGLLDSEHLPGREWFAERDLASKAADKARKAVLRAAGVDDMSKVSGRLVEVLQDGKPRDAKLFKAVDDYGTAVSKFDRLMLPTEVDDAHLGSILGQLDRDMQGIPNAADLADETRKIKVPTQAEANAELRAYNDARRPAGGGVGPANRLESPEFHAAKTQELPIVGADESLTGKLRGTKAALDQGTPLSKVSAGIPEPGTAYGDTRLTPGREDPRLTQRIEMQGPKERYGPFSDVHGPQQSVSQGAAYQARGALQAQAQAFRPPQVSELGYNIQGAMDRLHAATGGKLGSEQTKILAKKLGISTAALDGPLSSKLVDLWGLKRLAGALADETTAGPGKQGILAKALRGGAIASGAQLGRKTAGSFGAGAMGHMLGATLGAAGTIAATAGRVRQAAVLGIARVLSPAGRKALTIGVVSRPLLTSYDGSPPTRNFDQKAAQLRQLAAAPDAVRANVQEQLSELSAYDPALASGVAESAVRRIKNLERHVPTGTYRGPFEPPGPPDQGKLDEFHQYEMVTADKRLVFDYIKSGFVPEIVVDAMNEQHPEFVREVRDYVMQHPEEIAKAPYTTKLGLSAVLGVHLTREAEPDFALRQQAAYQEAKQKAAQKKMMQQGAGSIKAGMQPLPGQVYSAMPMTR